MIPEHFFAKNECRVCFYNRVNIKKKSLLSLFLTFGLMAFADEPNGLFFKTIPAKTVVFTFDDSCLSHFTTVGPLLKANGFNGSFYISEFDSFATRKDWYMTWAQIKSLSDDGFDVGNHTSDHGVANVNNVMKLENDLITNNIPKPTTFCWPLGANKPAFYDTLYAKGYLFARGGGDRAYKPAVDNPFNVPSYGIQDINSNTFYTALSGAIAGQAVVFTFHGVPDGEHPTAGIASATLTNLVQYLKVNNYTVISLRDLGRYVGRINASFTNTPVTDCASASAVLHTTFRCAGLTNTVYAHWNTLNGGTNATLWTNSAPVGIWTNVGPQSFDFAGGTNAAYVGIFTNMLPTNLSYTATGLTTNTTYYFTFSASNEWGSVWATNVLSFRMGAPAVDNSPGTVTLASGVTQLRGTLAGGAADVYLYWGAADGGTTQAAWSNTNVLSGVNVGAFSGDIVVGNPLYGRIYYYRCYASNAYSTAWASATATFTTLKPTAPPPVISNGSFETPILTSGTRQARPSGASWTFVSNNEVGIDACSGTWWYPTFVPDGRQAAYLYGYGQVVSVAQTLTFAKAGTYAVCFNAISREGSPAELDVQIDGSNVLVIAKGVNSQYNWSEYTTPALSLQAGAHTLTFINTNKTGGASSIDSVSIAGAGDLITLANSAATGVTNSSATLNATLGCTGSVYEVYACWNTINGGTIAALWTNAVSVGSYTNSALTNLGVRVTGLAPNTSYFFTFYATNASETVWASEPLGFSTSAFSNIPPVIEEGSLTNVVMSEDGLPVPFSLTLHGSDSDGGLLAWGILANALHGTATVEGTGESCSVSYAPVANYNGDDCFTVQLSDGQGNQDVLVVNVTLLPVNDAPLTNTVLNQVVVDVDNNGRQVVTLDSTDALDVDGTIVRYVWYEDGIPLATGRVVQVAFAVGAHQVELTLQDDCGSESVIPLTITVAKRGVFLSEDFEHEWADNAMARTTNGWTSSGVADLSSIINPATGYDRLPGGVVFPLIYDHKTQRRLLNVDTQGEILSTPTLDADFTLSAVYVDMMIKLGVLTELPSTAPTNINAKAVLFLLDDGVATNLVVLHGQKTETGFGEPIFTKLPNAFDPAAWYRLTVTFDATTNASGAEAFCVRINGQPLTSPAAYGDTWKERIFSVTNAPDGGAWFLSAARRTNISGMNLDHFTHATFEGEGTVDDLVVTSDNPIFSFGTLLMFASNQHAFFGDYEKVYNYTAGH